MTISMWNLTLFSALKADISNMKARCKLHLLSVNKNFEVGFSYIKKVEEKK